MYNVKRFKTLLIPLCVVCLVSSVLMLLHSINGSHLVGCGVGSGCESVMNTQWAYLAGKIPVSFFAVVTYLMLIVCVLFLSGRGGEENESLDKLIWPMMFLLGGSIVGAAIWFGYLQSAVLHLWCKYCTLTHLLGSIVAVIIVAFAAKGWRRIVVCLATGIAASAIFAYMQVVLMPSVVYEDGETAVQLPSFGQDALPTLGPEDAEHTVTLMFDFQCTHCRALHRLLPEVLEQSGGKVRFQLCPVALSSECNPYLPHDGVDRFAGSCMMSRLALAVWFARPELYDEVETFLMGSGDDNLRIGQAGAKAYVASLMGKEALDEALLDPRIKAYMQKSAELFGRTSSAERGGIPKLICRQRWLVPETDSAIELAALIQEKLLD